MAELSEFLIPLQQYWQSAAPIERSILAVLCTVVSFYLVRYVFIRRLERVTANTENDFDDRLIHFIKQFLWLGAIVVGLIWVLKINSIQIGPVLAGAGIAGIAIGLAAKETLADILAGIFLIADRPIRIGDRIDIDKIGRHWGGWGDVVDIGLRRTMIRNTDGVIVNYPNSVLGSTTIKNFSFDPQPVRARVRFQTDYSADIDLVKQTVINAVNRVEGVINDTVTVVIRSMWDDDQGHLLSGVLFEARYKLEDVRTRTPIRSSVLTNIIQDLHSAEIPMAATPVKVV